MVRRPNWAWIFLVFLATSLGLWGTGSPGGASSQVITEPVCFVVHVPGDPVSRHVFGTRYRAVSVTQERTAVLLFVFLDRRFGPNVIHFDAVAILDPLAQFQRLLELVARLQIKNADVRLQLRQHVNDAVAFRAERSRHRQSRKKLGDCPA